MRSKVIALKKVVSIELLFFMTLTMTAILSPLFGAQAVSGPLVNATLFLATIFLGIKTAVFIAVFPSVVALAVGILPLPAAPFIPFIITANIILVLVFNYFLENFWKGVIIASFFKFLFLFISSQLIAHLILKEGVARQIVAMMSWPQFATALTGGVIAYFVLQILQNYDILKK